MARQLTMRPHLNVHEIRKRAVLDQQNIGVFFAWIMPIWVAFEELHFEISAPGRWNEVSDVVAHMDVALGGAEDVGDKFQLRLSWEHAPGEVPIPATSNDVDVETTVLAGRAAQYDHYEIDFTIDYNIDGVGNEIKPHESVGMRLRRIAATANEVDNDVLILDWHVHWPIDKMFAPLKP